jgi:NADPH:quinone reductase-like Zn-dependent oxidoreductase
MNVGESRMRAAMVEDFSRPPRYGETSLPVANEGEVLLQVRAAALSNLVRSQANGLHYSSVAAFPFTPGNDGVGIVPEDGSRVYFIAPRAPFGSMAEYSVVSRAMTPTSTMRMRPRSEIRGLRPGAPSWEGRNSRRVKQS